MIDPDSPDSPGSPDLPPWSDDDAIGDAQTCLEEAIEHARRDGIDCVYGFSLCAVSSAFWITTLTEAMPLTAALIATIERRPVMLRGLLKMHIGRTDEQLRADEDWITSLWIAPVIASPQPTGLEHVTRFTHLLTVNDVRSSPWPFLLSDKPMGWMPF